MEALNLDIPFDCRFSCWFCGEGSHQTVVTTLSTPQNSSPINIPICDECKSYRCHHEVNSLLKLKALIKEKIGKRSAKELAIGVNWTEAELQQSELSGSAFDGFIRSAWPMYLIAKERVNYSGWAISIDGIPIDLEELDDASLLEEVFEFDGLNFTSFISMLDYLSDAFSLNKAFLKQVLTLYGHHRAIEAIKFCRLVPHYSTSERESAVNDLIESFREKSALELKK